MAKSGMKPWTHRPQFPPSNPVPDDVAEVLLDLRDEIGKETYIRWVDANVLDNDNWQRVKAIAARELDYIQERRDKIELISWARGG